MPRIGNVFYNEIDNHTGESFTFSKVTKHFDGSTMIDAKVDGVIYTKKGTEYFKRNFTGPINVKWFGAVGDAKYESNGVLYKDANLTQIATDDFQAIQKAINIASDTNINLLFPTGGYRVTDTLTFRAITINSISLLGSGMISTIIWFDNETEDKEMVHFNYGCTHMSFIGLYFADLKFGTSRFTNMYFSLTEANGKAPLWKDLFMNCEFAQFNLVFNLDAPASLGDQAYLSEFTLFHCKFKNNKVAIRANNIQSVNTQLDNVDFENDRAEDLVEKFTHILLTRGGTINHKGGSVIGAGSYLKIQTLLGGEWQPGSAFTSTNIRVEHRGDAEHIPAPLIHHDETVSNIIYSHYVDIIINNMRVVSGTYPGPDSNRIFASLGGKIRLTVSNFYAAPAMLVRGWISKDMQLSGVTGFVKANDNVFGLSYVNHVAEGFNSYEGANLEPLNDNADICYPGVYQNTLTDGTFFTDTEDENYVRIPSIAQQIIPTGWGEGITRNVIIRPYNKSGFTDLKVSAESEIAWVGFIIPKGTIPIKLKIIKPGAVIAQPYKFTLAAMINNGVGGPDVEYIISEIDTKDIAGIMETEVVIPVESGYSEVFPDGIKWSGKTRLYLTGSNGETITQGFKGRVLIEYL